MKKVERMYAPHDTEDASTRNQYQRKICRITFITWTLSIVSDYVAAINGGASLIHVKPHLAVHCHATHWAA